MVILKFRIVFFLVSVGFVTLGCAKNIDGNTSFKEASKGFEKELPAEKRKKTIEALQAETDAAEARTNDRTVSPLPPHVVTPVNPPAASQPKD
jgi:hypothetical protein